MIFLKRISEKYLIYKYGFVYFLKPPFNVYEYRYYQSYYEIRDKIKYFVKFYVWKFDCYLTKFSGKERKEKWLVYYLKKRNRL